ncbi:MAG: NAD(+) synthase [Candidatus Marinamargulisbacteria bacterium]
MRIQGCQLRPTLGDISHNLALATTEIQRSTADIMVFSELFLTGYPSTDRLFLNGMETAVASAIDTLLVLSQTFSGLIIMGTPYFDGQHWRNAALAMAQGNVIHRHFKICLPTHDIFNDARYFVAGTMVAPFIWRGTSLAMLICEDAWGPSQRYPMDPIQMLGNHAIDHVIHLTASPFDRYKPQQRVKIISAMSTTLASPVISVNQVGGYADILFDGQSMATNALGQVVDSWAAFTPMVRNFKAASPRSCPPVGWDGIFNAMIFGLKEYMKATGLSSVLVGMSGGIDSALVALLAVHALGAAQVQLVTMPTIYNAQETQADAQDMADRLGCRMIRRPIEPHRLAVGKDVAQALNVPALSSLTDQNIQARLRGLLLMSMANQTGALLLTTGNKSELAMGYATLYGDMCGGLNPIGDLFKTEVAALMAHLADKTGQVPVTILSRPPSAELAFDQRDDDVLPPYDQLDPILEAYMIKKQSVADIGVTYGLETVSSVIQRLHRNEFKRYQSPPILKLSPQSFGPGWQFPLVT